MSVDNVTLYLNSMLLGISNLSYFFPTSMFVREVFLYSVLYDLIQVGKFVGECNVSMELET